MTNTDPQDFAAWIGYAVKDAAGEKVGKVSQIYMDDETAQPEWLAINTGLFKSRASFVPLQGAAPTATIWSSPTTRRRSKTPPGSKKTATDSWPRRRDRSCTATTAASTRVYR